MQHSPHSHQAGACCCSQTWSGVRQHLPCFQWSSARHLLQLEALLELELELELQLLLDMEMVPLLLLLALLSLPREQAPADCFRWPCLDSPHPKQQLVDHLLCDQQQARPHSIQPPSVSRAMGPQQPEWQQASGRLVKPVEQARR